MSGGFGLWWALVAISADGHELGRMGMMLRPECEHAIYQRAGEFRRFSARHGDLTIAYTATDQRGRRVTFTCQPEVQQ